ncbi:MAG: CAP domain-containing protein [Lachnospiraceae bacterium]|nr:CAP domain-containing protein [Lachnospiraceae bacterium]
MITFAMLFSVDAFAAVDINALNNRMLSSINELRASNGVKALTLDRDLISVANIRSQEASSNWSHTRPNGEQGVELISSDKWKGENLSRIKGTEDPVKAASVMFEDLVASPAHYDNMVFGEFTRIGISSYVEGDKITVAYLFSN